MWDNPRLLNAAAAALFALSFALAVYAAGRMLAHSSVFPLKAIRVEGELRHVGRDDVVDALQGRVSGTFFTADLEGIRAIFEGIAWVRRAEVRRRWPDRLEVRLEEHVALAYWGQIQGQGQAQGQAQGQEQRLVNTFGELFSGRTDAALPLLGGPAGSEREVARSYALFRELFAPLELEPQAVLLSPRHAWRLKLSNGLTLQLGRESDKDRILDRLARFVAAYPLTIGKLSRHLDYVDLRYPNGFALRIPDLPGPAAHKAPRKQI